MTRPAAPRTCSNVDSAARNRLEEPTSSMHEEPTILLTNDRRSSAAKLITRYAQRIALSAAAQASLFLLSCDTVGLSSSKHDGVLRRCECHLTRTSRMDATPEQSNAAAAAVRIYLEDRLVAHGGPAPLVQGAVESGPRPPLSRFRSLSSFYR